MRRFLILLAILIASCSPKGQQDAVNPLTYTDIPDSDIIRVGEDYYMVSTTMYYCPAVPIMHSKDLVHWELVSYVCDYIADDDFYNLRNGKNAYGKGQWATSLQYENGIYYILFIANDQRKTFIYTTEDIVNGPWKLSVLDRPMHDASLFFEDGRVYSIWGNGEIYIAELEPDMSGFKEGGVDQLLFTCPRKGYMLRAEGTRFYRIGDYYYAIVIDWPRGGVRTATAWRSTELLGTYEPKTMLQGAFDGRGDGVAQGPLVETQFGDWYAVMFQDHGGVGRIPTIQPVTWVDGWPIMGDNTVPMKTVTVNLPESGVNRTWASDDFSKDKLDLVWQWNHKPVNELWSLTERKGWMRLKTGDAVQGLLEARNSLTQRTVGPKCVSEVKMDLSGLKPGDRAGIAAFQSANIAIGAEISDDGTKYLVLRTSERDNRDKEYFKTPLKAANLWLKLDYCFTPSENDDREADTCVASYSTDGKNWIPIDYTLKMRFSLDLFTGYRTALYCYSTIGNGGYADFDYFKQTQY